MVILYGCTTCATSSTKFLKLFLIILKNLTLNLKISRIYIKVHFTHIVNSQLNHSLVHNSLKIEIVIPIKKKE